MGSYRLYYLDQRGHIVGVADLDCSNDEDAISVAEEHRDGRAMELWCLDRRVRSFTDSQDR